MSGNGSFQYFKPRDGLPDYKGLLSLAITLWAISIANREVTEVTTADKKRGPYKKYSSEERCQIAHYTCDRIEL